MNTDYKKIAADGLWHSNPGLVQLLGLCPLLAVSSTFINALGLGIATTLVMVCSNATVSVIRDWVRQELRIPVFVIIIASFVTAVELAMSAFVYELYTILGIFIPLIVTNCIILARAESFASKNNVGASAFDGLMMGLGFTLLLLTIGSLREILGQGTLFSQADLMFGEAFAGMQLTVISDYQGFLLAMLPPGAFLILGVLIAIKNVIDSRREAQAKKVSAASAEENLEAEPAKS